ncbi:tail fiber protein [uncultured phage_MedDCM-OCT-S42-C7]|uniref:Tail fiber n=1 Tax=uncultured phage_MedDCM-OCT-S42-C7 TaxID=2741073 RepID=A0A6S4PG25_9CAUD|nr:tail fiber protein [uncultured phage_MedDCM-OCT-S42-C7]BAQ94123.1 tail fiber [uncultured phage_MedDCM-OCT-S42-C7]
MANSFVRYTGNGSTTQYAVNFTYRDQADITVTINGVATTAFTYNASGTQITFNTAPASASAIEIRRTTSQTSRLVDYAAGSVLTENDLDTDSNQAFFMSQEAIDDAGDVIKLDNANFQWDVQNKRLTNVADPVNNTDGVNKQFISTNLPNITTVAGISGNVTTVAGISANVTSVASNSANINTVATNIANVNTVASDIAKVIVVANDLNETVSEIETAALDLQETTSEIDTVSNNIANVNTVGTNIANVNTLAPISANITTVAGISANVTTVAGISSNVTSVANNSSNINSAVSNATNINTVAGNNSNITTVAGISSDVTNVANIASDVSAVENIKANVTTVAGISANVTTAATNNANITTVANAITNVNNVGGSIANVNSVASNLSGVNSFAERYRIASSAPSSSNDVGDLYFDTTANELKVYKTSGWAAAGSTVNGTSNRFEYTATAGQTTFSGADANGSTLAYDAGFIDLYVNGIKLANSDFTATSGNSVVLASAAAVNDIISVVAYGTFQLANISIKDLTDTPASFGTAGQALVMNTNANGLEFANASSAEVYGFNLSDTNSDNINDSLTVTTTNGGNDNINASTYAAFDDVVYAATGFSWSLNSNGHLIATI